MTRLATAVVLLLPVAVLAGVWVKAWRLCVAVEAIDLADGVEL